MPRVSPQQMHKKITEMAQASNSTKIALGEYLLSMKEGGKFREVAGEGSTWGEYLASPEVKIPYASAHRYITIAEKYIVELGLSYEDLYGLDTWALYYCAKVVTKENQEEWLENIRTLSRSDIQQLVKYQGKDQMVCKHGNLNKMPSKWKCEDCGIITNVDPNETKL